MPAARRYSIELTLTGGGDDFILKHHPAGNHSSCPVGLLPAAVPGGLYRLPNDFFLNAATTFVVRPYDSGGRTDVSEILALSGNYRIRDWLTVSAVSTFVANQSNQSIFDYNVFNIGGGVTLSWKF